jgi:drug/metabolite transporter (DMT)-like permease
VSEPVVVAADPSAETCEAAEHQRHARSVAVGTLCSFFSAVLYTCTNIGLRDVAALDAVWVSCIKAVPTFVAAAALILYDMAIGRGARLPGLRATVGLLCTGVLAHLGGNVAFQWGLGIVGLAATVPLTFSTILVTGALLSRYWLDEPITGRTWVAIAVLTLAFICVSLHTERVADQPIVNGPHSPETVALAVGVVCFSGLAYAMLGASIRRTVTGSASLHSVLFLTAVPGLVCLGPIAAARVGFEGLVSTSGRDLAVMLTAGSCNAVAFFSLSRAMQLVPVAYVNIVNASQVAMAAVAGVVLFAEPTTTWLLSGLLFTAIGLVLNRRPVRKA